MNLIKNIFSRNVETSKNKDFDIVSPIDGEILPLEFIHDDMFSKQLMGKTLAIKTIENKKVVVCSPVNGKLTTIFPSGHAFGITTDDGVETLVHIGINTVESEGEGFKILKKEYNRNIYIGEPIVEVNIEYLSQFYDLTIFVIVTNSNGKEINFKSPSFIKKEQSLLD
ncbi:PTS sugar transporter subunit IIA [Streptococcus uberis]|uniref:PTS sugar transporter subunit IIA n=1 Tax=Streptococcus uberis TaxID=1349 RepID=UPI00193AD485|nr:glucose PTS transporter subunit IIA [Streptococcus uberis]